MSRPDRTATCHIVAAQEYGHTADAARVRQIVVISRQGSSTCIDRTRRADVGDHRWLAVNRDYTTAPHVHIYDAVLGQCRLIVDQAGKDFTIRKLLRRR